MALNLRAMFIPDSDYRVEVNNRVESLSICIRSFKRVGTVDVRGKLGVRVRTVRNVIPQARISRRRRLRGSANWCPEGIRSPIGTRSNCPSRRYRGTEDWPVWGDVPMIPWKRYWHRTFPWINTSGPRVETRSAYSSGRRRDPFAMDGDSFQGLYSALQRIVSSGEWLNRGGDD